MPSAIRKNKQSNNYGLFPDFGIEVKGKKRSEVQPTKYVWYNNPPRVIRV